MLNLILLIQMAYPRERRDTDRMLKEKEIGCICNALYKIRFLIELCKPMLSNTRKII